MPAYKDGDVTYIRPRKFKDIKPGRDDLFYEVVDGDSWLLVSWKAYGDIRLWWLAAQIWVNECAEQELSRETYMDNNTDPEPGSVLRLPSRSRVLTELLP
jgi:hypothetical protein